MKATVLLIALILPASTLSAASDAARVSGDLKVDGLHFSKDGSTISSGNDLLRNKGAWQSSALYSAGDVVQSGGGSYVCISANTNNSPPNATYWTALGTQGPVGPAGPVGPQGPACSPLGVVCSLGEVYVQAGTGIQCGRIIPFTNSIGTCIEANCFLNCWVGYGDCDNDKTNGCEISFLEDSLNCGTCGNACQLNQVCTKGVCENNTAALTLSASATQSAGVVFMSATALLTPAMPGVEVTFVTTMFNASGALPVPAGCSGNLTTNVTGTAMISCNMVQPSTDSILQLSATTGGLTATPVSIPIAAQWLPAP